MRDFRELKVWQLAHQLALDTYKMTGGLPRQEMYGLTLQLRRSAVSVGANIVEGSARHSDASMRQFLTIAHGSTAELEYLILIARDLGYLDSEAHEALSRRCVDLRRMLSMFIRRLSSKPKPGHKT
ncbi:MAG TPA: four helix bundle protein [Gemmatimonadales bacterium]|nr:four helix bundle protein [Gemmatimonadales bacterium]